MNWNCIVEPDYYGTWGGWLFCSDNPVIYYFKELTHLRSISEDWPYKWLVNLPRYELAVAVLIWLSADYITYTTNIFFAGVQEFVIANFDCNDSTIKTICILKWDQQTKMRSILFLANYRRPSLFATVHSQAVPQIPKPRIEIEHCFSKKCF